MAKFGNRDAGHETRRDGPTRSSLLPLSQHWEKGPGGEGRGEPIERPRPDSPIIIVGGRVAGATTAITLARSGYRVLVLERDHMPSDTLSTHVIWPDGLAALERLGLLKQVLETGAPPARHFRLCRGADCIETALLPYDAAGRFDAMLCVRRHLLDGILWEAARNTPKVEVRDQVTVRGVRWEDDRVVGVTVDGPDGEQQLDAALVIGADGRNSLIARQVGAAEADTVPAGRYWYYSYFQHAKLPDPPALVESDSATDTVVAMPTNDGLLMVILGAYNEDFQEFRKDHRANFLTRANAHPAIAEMLQGASLAGPVAGIAGVRGYYRQAWGPGWALIGDAAHQKDPLVARGISEALRSAEWLAKALSSGICDEALTSYAANLRERTRSKALNARMLSRPDWHMTAEQGAKLSQETIIPEGLARYLLLEYSDTLTFDDYFS